MKKIISLLMVLCLMASLCSMSAFAEDGGETAPPLPNAKVEFTSGADYAPLTYALRFAVDFDTLTQAQRDYYGDWPTDFVLTSNKNANLCAGNINEILANEYVFTAEGYDGYIAGSYPSFGGGLWVPVPFLGTSEGLDGVPAITFNDQPLTLRANNGVDVMGYLLEATGFDEIFDMDFDFVVNMVKEFSCGIYFTDEFLLNNPGTNVVVQLIMTNPETGERHIIGKELYYNTPGSSKEQPLKLEESVVVSEPIVVSGDTYIELQNNTLKNAFSLAPGADSLFQVAKEASVTILGEFSDEEVELMRSMVYEDYCVYKGSIVVRGSHEYVDGVCACGDKLPSTNVPATADNSNMPLWSLLFIGFAAVAVLTAKKKKA